MMRRVESFFLKSRVSGRDLVKIRGTIAEIIAYRYLLKYICL